AAMNTTPMAAAATASRRVEMVSWRNRARACGTKMIVLYFFTGSRSPCRRPRTDTGSAYARRFVRESLHPGASSPGSLPAILWPAPDGVNLIDRAGDPAPEVETKAPRPGVRRESSRFAPDPRSSARRADRGGPIERTGRGAPPRVREDARRR